MIMTVVTADGKLQAAAAGDVRAPDFTKLADSGGFRAGLVAGPGQTIRVIDVPDTFADLVADPSELTARLSAILSTRGLL
jgi:hypothetical protein